MFGRKGGHDERTVHHRRAGRPAGAVDVAKPLPQSHACEKESLFRLFRSLSLPQRIFRRKVSLRYCLLAFLCFLAVSFARAESVGPVLITQNVDESKLATLGGNTRPEAMAKYDRGLVADNLLMEHMLLLLKRSPEQEQELEKLIDELTDSSSPNFHRWLTAEEFGERFGVAKQDRDTIKNWLQSHGLKVNVDYSNDVLIDFSGTAGQVRGAFHTEIHNLEVKGEKHIANMSDPRIPAALAPAVVGVVSLHNFMPDTLTKLRPEYTFGGCSVGTCYAVVPADLETIYNLIHFSARAFQGKVKRLW